MKIFISWSGNTSKEVAEYLRTWIEQIIQAAEPWISVEINKGKRWNQEISLKLEESKIGIFCITKENLNAPWILFEAGAISKSHDSFVCTFLIDLQPTDLIGPLSLFQATKFNKEDVFKLLTTINQSIAKYGGRSLSIETLKSLFEKFYPELEIKIKQILSIIKSDDTQEIRTDRELLEESIQILRSFKLVKSDSTIEKEAKELLDFYAKKYAKMVQGLNYDEVGNDLHIDDFMKYIHDNPLLLKFFGGKDGLKSYISIEYDDLPF
ncbi:MAG: TIR domain-containing protein [Janthinobacterium lividum]